MKLYHIIESEYDNLEDADKFQPAGPLLGPAELDTTQQIALHDGEYIAAQKIGDSWSDDHIPCVQARIYVKHDNQDLQIDTTLWWCGEDIVGGLTYCGQSPQLLQDIKKHIQSFLS